MLMRLGAELRARFLPQGIRFYGRRNGQATKGQIARLEKLLPQVGLDGETSLDAAGIPKEAKVLMEIGFGNGEFLEYLAQREPEAWLVGIEPYLPGVAKALSRLDRVGALHRVRISLFPAEHVLEKQTPDAFLDGVFIHHPDPWPKKRHHKRRLIQKPFARLLARKLKPGGFVKLSTDWPELAEWMRDILDETPGLVNVAGK
ncbi:MAG: tRNA (guanosine(46)-N7)-methyltransferase TrmB, partial [Zetaproteobacteria bacterium]